MKVLFAVSNEEISESIVKKYQREYKEIISYKNVYYFNAILKELQKDKNYDRIVISEELEAFTNTQYDQIDKFIFDKLDGISDEASNLKGEDIPIIVICSDRREKSEQMLVKLFGIGIYNALIGNDRSVENVCRLLNKPRLKKEAKIYYKIDSEDVTYQSENENDVSEIEIQNIIAHYKRLGKDEKKYIESFNNIASQYNDIQLKIICKFLPLNVRAVLEEKSAKYQQVMAYNSKVSDSLRSQKIDEKSGTSATLLKTQNKDKILSRPVIIPSAVNMQSMKKMSKTKPVSSIEPEIEIQREPEEVKDIVVDEKIEKSLPIQDDYNEQVEETNIVTPKRGRGRPRKNPVPQENEVSTPKRGRGRPRKNPIPEEQEEITLPEIEEQEETILPGFKDEQEETTTLPGFEEVEEQKETTLPEIEEQEETILPGFNENDEKEQIVPGYKPDYNSFNDYQSQTNNLQTMDNSYTDVDISNLLTSNRKVACFVGTSKNGTSFIVNNLAEMTSSMGIDTAILDTTQNRNSYYIYTKNEEELRKTAMNSITNLLQGTANGIKVNKNLTVYTSLPNESEGIENAGAVLQTLLENHSLVLIDCDFNTPIDYFKKVQEIYLVQTFDVLTIQPLTAFLRELKSKNILEENKLKIILNKTVKVRGVNDKAIIGGMAYYNDPAMSFMTELFDKNTVRYLTMPFDEEVYARYLESVINCEISIKGYPKNIIQVLKELSNMIYPLVSGKSTYVPPKIEKNGFTSSMNSTLDQMKNRY